ncbi:hypothetical protein NC653_028917 [Populus alba x Populus x berolinensis]|uniref:Uncharacterized protein n=1 Tax=Populus alba x Populus x berolinensis TaxID=444605 RepID=A0AAD6M1Y8_9ROSI|nr:hypothetical protein NC653_028917 [Populus alba x Populus x berolinensis]
MIIGVAPMALPCFLNPKHCKALVGTGNLVEPIKNARHPWMTLQLSDVAVVTILDGSTPSSWQLK